MVGTQPASLGLDPAVYVYGKTGRHQPTAFLGIAAFIKELDKTNRLREFLKIRLKMEEFLLDNRIFITQIVTKRGSGAKGLPLIRHYYLRVMEMLLGSLDGRQITDGLRKDPLLSFLSAIEPEDAPSETLHSGSFSRDTKSAAYIREALATPLRCALCGGRMQSKSISIDHIHDIKHGGSSASRNAQLTHPYCNSIKDQLVSTAR